MSKRPSSTSEGLPPSKRRQTDNESVELIVSHSDELIKCLQALSKSPKGTSPQGDMLQNLRSLSKKLLPSFKYLAGEEESLPENEKIESKVGIFHAVPRRPDLQICRRKPYTHIHPMGLQFLPSQPSDLGPLQIFPPHYHPSPRSTIPSWR